MAKRSDKRTAGPKAGARAVPVPTRSDTVTVAALIELDQWRRYELGVEALCELICDILVSLTQAAELDKSAARRASTDFAQRFSGFSLAVANPTVMLNMDGWVPPMSTGRLLWMCLKRVLEFTEALSERDSTAHWRQIHEIVEAWRDAWGDDKRAQIAQARFSTLTGITRGHQNKLHYMHEALVKALSEVQA